MRVLESWAHRLPAEPIRTTLRSRLYGTRAAQLKPSPAVKTGGTAPPFAAFAAGERDFCRHARTRARLTRSLARHSAQQQFWTMLGLGAAVLFQAGQGADFR